MTLPPLDAAAILRTLVEHGVEFVLIGGLAVAAHGYVRATKDVDIVPASAPDNHERLYEALLAIGARPLEIGDFRPEELPVPFTPEGLASGGNWALVTDHGRVDVMQWVSGIDGYEQLRANAEHLELPNVGRVAVAGYEDLVAMKREARRPRDLLDLEELAAVRRER
ncbi:MAG TPA: hypothetical protein VM290_11275 [Gaiellaceae bacterium]|nr:hypothetical protein [Gaiellaceae bacterium]